MTRRTGFSAKMRTAAALLAAALLFAGEAHAQSSSGGGPLNFLNNIFSGPKGNQTANQPAARAARRRAARRQRTVALERRGRRLRPSPDDGERDPRGGGQF